eukprot:s448_g5.t1
MKRKVSLSWVLHRESGAAAVSAVCPQSVRSSWNLSAGLLGVMASQFVFALALSLIASASASLRGSELQCSGEGNLPAGPVCFGGTLLTQTFNIHVVSHDGAVGIVDLKAEGPQSAECDGAQFQNDANVITIENDHGCGLAKYEYTDNLVVNLVKPYSIRMVLESQSCPAAGEV